MKECEEMVVQKREAPCLDLTLSRLSVLGRCRYIPRPASGYMFLRIGPFLFVPKTSSAVSTEQGPPEMCDRGWSFCCKRIRVQETLPLCPSRSPTLMGFPTPK